MCIRVCLFAFCFVKYVSRYAYVINATKKGVLFYYNRSNKNLEFSFNFLVRNLSWLVVQVHFMSFCNLLE